MRSLPNRPDCLSMVGMAREIGATTGRPWFMPEINVGKGTGSVHEELQVEVEDANLCPRYMAKVVKDIKLEPSPAGCAGAWLRQESDLLIT